MSAVTRSIIGMKKRYITSCAVGALIDQSMSGERSLLFSAQQFSGAVNAAGDAARKGIMPKSEQTEIAKLIAAIKPHLPQGWSVSEAIHISLSTARTSAEFALISGPRMPREFSYLATNRNTPPEERAAIRERRRLWRAERENQAREIANHLRVALADGVRVICDATQVEVKFL